LWLPGAAPADSLLDPNAPNLYTPRPIQVGELITVEIVDKAKTVQGVDLKRKTETTLSGPTGTGLLEALLGFELGGGEDRKTSEQATSKQEFENTVTARVVAVEPGDVLVLEASNKVQLDGKERSVALRGRVRRQDVSPGNVVSSTMLADAVVTVEGATSSPVGGGILSWVLDILR
ncbi:MAG: flagellar basal body L-ring protein FlgH, partial [Candidatus Eremiobacterota bacterium]